MFRGKFWHTPEQEVRGLLFKGGPDLLRLIDHLYRRPWRLWLEKYLPIVFLTTPPGEVSPLVGIRNRLADAGSGSVQHASISARSAHAQTSSDPQPPGSSAEETTRTVEELLGAAVAQLGDKFRRRRRLRFPHYTLATWFLHLKLETSNRSDGAARDKDGDDITGRLKQLMKDYRFKPIVTADVGEKIAAGAPWWVRIATYALPKLALHLMWFTWRPRRWLARNPLLGMANNRSLNNVARWFLSEDGAGADRRDVHQLLVDAFLEDLRRAYRRKSIFGVGRRRTGYPVLLVDSLSAGTGEFSLLELINDVRIRVASERLRRGRGRYLARDPLLVVAAGERPITGTRRSHPRADAWPAYLDWERDLLTAGSDLTWFLDFEIPDEKTPSVTRNQLGEVRLRRLRRPWISYGVSIAVLGALTSALIYIPLANPSRCQPRWSLSLTSSLRRVPLKNGRDQCIGLSDTMKPFDSRLYDVWAEIEESNTQAMSDARHLTVAYLGMLTTPNEDSYRFVREELKGIAVAQRSMLSTIPIRIVLANSGDGMMYAPEVAQQIAGRAQSESTDSKIASVLGMGISNNKAREAMITLERAGLAIVGTETSADSMSETSPNYYQVGPNNLREATVVADYVKSRLHLHKARIYYSGDPQDIYSKNLADDVRSEFSNHHISVVDSRGYRAPGNPLAPEARTLGGQACQAARDEVVFYAGRAEDLTPFTQGIAERCPGRTPRILAGDDMSRLFLSEGRRTIPGVPMDYIAFASSAAWGTDCIRANGVISLYSIYEEMFGSACEGMLDGNAIVAYDAFLVITKAVEFLHGYRDDVDVSKLLGGIAAIKTGPNLLVGASGEINYGDPAAPQVPADKTVMVLRTSTNSSPCVIDIEGRRTIQMRPTVACEAG